MVMRRFTTSMKGQARYSNVELELPQFKGSKGIRDRKRDPAEGGGRGGTTSERHLHWLHQHSTAMQMTFDQDDLGPRGSEQQDDSHDVDPNQRRGRNQRAQRVSTAYNLHTSICGQCSDDAISRTSRLHVPPAPPRVAAKCACAYLRWTETIGCRDIADACDRKPQLWRDVIFTQNANKLPTL